MSLAIMQPYFFPYIGYFQLLNAVDTYVIADDLNYIKNGFINKNTILMNNQEFKISLQLKGASQNKLINEIEVGDNGAKLLETIRRSYKKAPHFEDAFPLIEKILLNKEKNLAKFLGDALIRIAAYLEMDTKILYSSEIEKDNFLMMDERIIDICNRLHEKEYVNAVGGKNLYCKLEFSEANIDLKFINKKKIMYEQFNNDFIAKLSLIDVLMFNSVSNIKEMLVSYDLV